jgi:Double zinc ribbon
MQCPRCQHDAPSDAEFCPECGTKLAAVCAQCGTANASGHKFCRKYGQPLTFAAGARPEGGRFGSPESPAARRRGQSRAPPRADAHCHFGLAKLYCRTGNWAKAEKHLTTATMMYREMDMRFWLEQAEATG